MEGFNNWLIGFVSSIPTYGFTAFVFLSNTELPMWMWLVSSIVMPFAVGFSLKYFEYWLNERKNRRKDE